MPLKRPREQPIPEPPPTTPIPPVVTPAPVITPKPTLGLTKLGSYGNASIDQWDAAFIAGSNAVSKKRGIRVNPHIMKAMMDVETGGNGAYRADQCRPCDGTDCIPACGPMQIKRRYHFHRCPECDFSTVPGQIELATHIIGMTMLERGRDEYDALVTTYFPGGDINGTSQKQYVDRVRKLVGIMEGDLDEEDEEDEDATVTQQQILDLISNHAPGVYISFPFRGIGNGIYAYGKGHGTSANNAHSGIDIWMPDETAVSCVFGGEVICVGNAGTPVWGQGCGYFNDENGGLGNITILTDKTVVVGGKMRALKMTYGHMSSAVVRVGQRVANGERIGRSGVGGGWPHVHLDTVVNAPDLNNPQIWNNPGEYHLIDPIPTIQSAFSGMPLPKRYAERVPVPQPSDWDGGALVTVTKAGVPLLQRARKDAAEVDSPFEKGDTFEAVQLAWVPEEKSWYWITRRGTRVPTDGTASVDGPKVATA